MALTGLHVACAPVNDASGAALAGKPFWSQTMASAGTTSRSASTNLGVATYAAMFEVRSSVDAYIAVGKAPDASQVSGVDDAARFFLAAGETRNVFCQPGDKLAWVAA